MRPSQELEARARARVDAAISAAEQEEFWALAAALGLRDAGLARAAQQNAEMAAAASLRRLRDFRAAEAGPVHVSEHALPALRVFAPGGQTAFPVPFQGSLSGLGRRFAADWHRVAALSLVSDVSGALAALFEGLQALLEKTRTPDAALADAELLWYLRAHALQLLPLLRGRTETLSTAAALERAFSASGRLGVEAYCVLLRGELGGRAPPPLGRRPTLGDFGVFQAAVEEVLEGLRTAVEARRRGHPLASTAWLADAAERETTAWLEAAPSVPLEPARSPLFRAEVRRAALRARALFGAGK